MRIIAGEKKGLFLVSPPGSDIRPTYDKVREAVFGRLQFVMGGRTVLDLFSGSGAMGLEALSRGADFVCFVDKSGDAIKTVTENVSKFHYEDKTKILKNDYLAAVNQLKNSKKFDLVFIDPPYACDFYNIALKALDSSGLLQKGAILVLESDAELKGLAENFIVSKSKKYGKAYITYLEYLI